MNGEIARNVTVDLNQKAVEDAEVCDWLRSPQAIPMDGSIGASLE